MNKKAIITDDVSANRFLINAFLKKHGWESVEFESGPALLNFLNTTNDDFSLLILDIQMPGMTGDNVCRQIKAMDKWKHLWTVAYTAHAFKEEREIFKEAGFDDFLIKPIKADNIGTLLETQLEAYVKLNF